MSQTSSAPRLVAITGMHRSGTSVVAGAVQLLGASFGDAEQLMGPGPDNPKGYWENRPVKELDDELLAALGGSWDRPPALERRWQEAGALDELRTRASQLLDEAFGGEPAEALVALKDPRLSLLLPFWRTVRPVDVTVLVVRDPLEVVASLGSRNEMSPGHAALLWLRYVLAAMADDPDLVIDHRAFFDDPAATLAELAAALELPPPTPQVLEDVEGHVDPALRHHRREPTDQPDPLVDLADQVWNGGDLRTDLLGPQVAEAIALGWLRSPSADRELTAARAKVAKLEGTMRRRVRTIRELQARLEAAERPSTTEPRP